MFPQGGEGIRVGAGFVCANVSVVCPFKSYTWIVEATYCLCLKILSLILSGICESCWTREREARYHSIVSYPRKWWTGKEGREEEGRGWGKGRQKPGREFENRGWRARTRSLGWEREGRKRDQLQTCTGANIIHTYWSCTPTMSLYVIQWNLWNKDIAVSLIRRFPYVHIL